MYGTPSALTLKTLESGMDVPNVSLYTMVKVLPFAASVAEVNVGGVVSTTVELLIAEPMGTDLRVPEF
jgi:hypothetical protein